MSRRDAILVVLSLVIIVAAVVLALRQFTAPAGPDDAEYREVVRRGNRIHVACTNPECGHTQDDFRAHSGDMDWPKECPNCGQKTLCRAVKCPGCKEYTPWSPGADGRILCAHCGQWLNPTPGGGEGPASP